MFSGEIKTVYKPDGTVQKTAVGFGGTSCQKALAPYEAQMIGLAGKPTEEALNPEPVYIEGIHQ